MIGRIALISSAMFLAEAGSVQAQKLALPTGDWAYSAVSAAACKRPPLTIEKDRLIRRIDQEGIRGESRCKVLKIMKQKNDILFLYTKCNWDKNVPQGMRESPDSDDDDSFSLKIVDNNLILFNNMNYRLCPSRSKGAQ